MAKSTNEVKARLVEFKSQEIKLCEKIRGLERDVETGLPEFVDDTVTDYSRPTPSTDTLNNNTNDLQSYNSSVFELGESSVSAATITAAPSRRKKGVVIRDPELKSATSSIIFAETKSKDKGKGIMVEEPKPLKKKQQIKLDEEYARKLHEELNKDIDWDEAIDHVKIKAKEDPSVKRYQDIKRKPQTESQARKNMMIYLKNVAGFRLDYFKTISYDDIRLIFKAKFNLNVDFLLNTKDHIEDKESRALLGGFIDFGQGEIFYYKPKNFSDDFLLTTLGAMFETPYPHAQIWKNQRRVYGQAKVKSWKLQESCGVQIITFTTTQLILLVERRKQVGDLSTHTTKYTSSTLTQKVFANMRRVGKGFSRVETPLFESMLLEQQVDEKGDADENVEEVNAGDAAEGEVSAAHGEVPTVFEEPSIPSPTPPTPPPQPSQDILSTSQERMIAKVDADADVVLKDVKKAADEAKEVAEDAKVDENVDIQGRQAESEAKIYKIDLDHANKDEQYSRELHAELNKDIDWDGVIDPVKIKAKEDPAIEEDNNRALQKLNETLAERAYKRRKLDEEVEELKIHLQTVPNEDDDVYTEATPLAQKNQRTVHGPVKLKGWKLLELCGVQIRTFTSTQLILLVERKYPLRRFTLNQMRNAVKLERREEQSIFGVVKVHSTTASRRPARMMVEYFLH
nr:hypothetical protein [Tanacetum cinerariifolium]